MEFNARQVFHLKFKGQRARVFADSNRKRALLGAGWIGVKTLSERHHLLAVDFVGLGVMLARFQLVNGNMLASDVG